MIAEHELNIRPPHGVLDYLDTVTSPVYYITNNIQKIILGKLKLFEKFFVCGIMTMYITNRVYSHNK